MIFTVSLQVQATNCSTETNFFTCPKDQQDYNIMEMNKNNLFAIPTARSPCTVHSDQLLPEAELVHGDGEVARLVVAVVQVAVVHGDQVHITEDEAIILSIL